MAIAWAELRQEADANATAWRDERAERAGGLWRSVSESTRPTCDVRCALSASHPPVALVASMHPAVMEFWLASPDAPGRAWAEQVDAMTASAAAGDSAVAPASCRGAEWDGTGMVATRSHAMRLEDCPAVRMAGDGPVEAITIAAAPYASSLFTELAERVLRRPNCVIGGGTFSRRSLDASWFDDVRALVFLHPPWGLAFDSLHATSFR